MLNLPTKCYFLNILGHFYPFFFNTTYRMAAFAAVSFAEGITFGAWLRNLAAPVASDGDETVTAGGNSWGYGARAARIDITAVAPDGNAGFNMHVFDDIYDGLSPDEAILWVKPLDIVKVSYGRHDNATLRGDACYGSWNWLRPSESWFTDGEGYLMSGNQKKGLMIEATPMEELYVQFFAPITTKEKAGTTYKNLQAGFAYTVPGLVKVKGQYIGMGAGSTDDKTETKKTYAKTDWEIKADGTIGLVDGATPTVTTETVKGEDGNSDCTLEAEVDVLAVEGLNVGLGFQYNVVKDADKKAGKNLKEALAAGTTIDDACAKLKAAPINQMKVALGASYQVMPELKVNASGAFFTYYKADYNGVDVKFDPRFQAGVGVDYDLGDGLAVNADFRYLSKQKADADGYDIENKNSDHMAFSVGVTKSVSSNGYIGVAFQGQTNSGTFANTVIPGKANDDGEMKNFTWAIPVALSVWF